jgi:hypothetical protein
MTPEALIKTLLAQREFWVELAEGKRVKLRRPAEMDVVKLLARDAAGNVTGININLAEVQRFAVAWEGFTEADLIGPAGAADAVAFDAPLWGVLIADQAEWCVKCADALVKAIIDHEQHTATTAGN